MARRTTRTPAPFSVPSLSFVPLVLVWIFGDKNLEPVWRLTFGFGIVPAALVLFWRLRMTREPELYHRSAIKRNIPYRLIIKRYWYVFWSSVALSTARAIDRDPARMCASRRQTTGRFLTGALCSVCPLRDSSTTSSPTRSDYSHPSSSTLSPDRRRN